MKLIIQIPCYNEEETLPLTLSKLPRSVQGFAQVEWLIIDDGCIDRTVEVARANGVDHVVTVPRNKGLANAFRQGLRACVENGADVIVNTDADNQYCAEDIPKLVDPILRGEADYVVGARPISNIREFSWLKRKLQRFGSWMVRQVSGVDVPDAPSGFRAMTRDVAMRLQVFSQYSYTLETLIQAGSVGIDVASVPIRVNKVTRKSRLMRGMFQYIARSGFTILRIFLTYRPVPFFGVPGIVSLSLGVAAFVRFLILFEEGEGSGHVQSLIAGAVLTGTGCALLLACLFAELVSVNRRLIEDMSWRMYRMQDERRATKN